MNKLFFSEENFSSITLKSGVPRSVLVQIFESPQFKRVQQLFIRHTLKDACRILGRARLRYFKKNYVTSLDPAACARIKEHIKKQDRRYPMALPFRG